MKILKTEEEYFVKCYTWMKNIEVYLSELFDHINLFDYSSYYNFCKWTS